MTLAQNFIERPPIRIPVEQYDGLADLAAKSLGRTPIVARFLLEELDRAYVIEQGGRRAHVVQVGSTVTYQVTGTASVRNVTLVYPGNADIARGWISVLTPVGAALIGMSAGQTISYPAPDGHTHELTVLSVVNVV